MLGEEHTQVLKSSLSVFEKAKPSVCRCIKMSWPLSTNLHKHTASCISSLFIQPHSLTEHSKMSSCYHPHDINSAVEGRVSSFGSSLKAVVYPPFVTPSSLRTKCATFARGGWRSLSASAKGGVGCVSKKGVGMCLGAAGSWHWVSADGENCLALWMEIVCNNIYHVGRFCL